MTTISGLSSCPTAPRACGRAMAGFNDAVHRDRRALAPRSPRRPVSREWPMKGGTQALLSAGRLALGRARPIVARPLENAEGPISPVEEVVGEISFIRQNRLYARRSSRLAALSPCALDLRTFCDCGQCSRRTHPPIPIRRSADRPIRSCAIVNLRNPQILYFRQWHLLKSQRAPSLFRLSNGGGARLTLHGLAPVLDVVSSNVRASASSSTATNLSSRARRCGPRLFVPASPELRGPAVHATGRQPMVAGAANRDSRMAGRQPPPPEWSASPASSDEREPASP